MKKCCSRFVPIADKKRGSMLTLFPSFALFTFAAFSFVLSCLAALFLCRFFVTFLVGVFIFRFHVTFPFGFRFEGREGALRPLFFIPRKFRHRDTVCDLFGCGRGHDFLSHGCFPFEPRGGIPAFHTSNLGD